MHGNLEGQDGWCQRVVISVHSYSNEVLSMEVSLSRIYSCCYVHWFYIVYNRQIISMDGPMDTLSPTQPFHFFCVCCAYHPSSYWDGAVLPMGLGLSLVINGLFIARYINRARCLTLPDFCKPHYVLVAQYVMGAESTMRLSISNVGDECTR